MTLFNDNLEQKEFITSIAGLDNITGIKYYCPEIEMSDERYIDDYYPHFSHFIEKIDKSFDTLQSMEVTNTVDCSNVFKALGNFKNLRHLKISAPSAPRSSTYEFDYGYDLDDNDDFSGRNISWFGDNHLIKLVEKLKKLRSLSLYSEHFVLSYQTYSAMMDIANKRKQQLTISVNKFKVTEEDNVYEAGDSLLIERYVSEQD